MTAHGPAPPKHATIALSYASSQSSTTQTSNHSSQLWQLIVQHHSNKQLYLSVMPVHSPAPPKQATIALSYASSWSSTKLTSNYSSQLCQLIDQHHPNKQLQLYVYPAHSPAAPIQATIALSYAGSQPSTIQTTTIAFSYASSQSSNTQTSNYSSQLCQLIVQHHSNKQLQLSVMPVHRPAPPKQATIALNYASSQSSTTQTSNYSSHLCQIIVQHHSNKQLQLSIMPAHSPAPPKQATIALIYARSLSSTTQTSNYSSLLCQLIVYHHPNKLLQLSVMPARSPEPPKQATIALSYASAQTSTNQTSNYSFQLCQLIVQHHPNKQLQLSVMPAHSPAPSKQATIALSYASSQSSTPKQAAIALSYASSESSTTQTSNHSSQLCQLIVQHTQTSSHSSQLCQFRVQHHPNKQLQLSVMPAHRPAPHKQATIALSYASSQSSTTQSSNHSSHYASSQSSTTQTRNYSSQLCQLIVQHHPNKQLQLSVMPAHSPAPPKQATIALSYASSQSSTTQTSNYSSQLCQLIVQHHPNKQPQLSVMPAHSQAPPKQATIALSYASSQSSTTQTGNYISQLCQLIVKHHPNKQPKLSVMPAHSPEPLKQAIIALSHASSQSSTTQTSKYSFQLCKLVVQYHPIKQLQLSVMPAHSPVPPKQATIALSFASSQSSTTQTSNLSSQLCQLIVQHHSNNNHSSQLCQFIVQHHSNKQLQLSDMPVHSLAPPKQATIALSYASSQSSTTQTSNYSSQLCQLIVQHHPNKQLQLSVMPAHIPAPPKQATIALSYASSQSSTIQTSNQSSQFCKLVVQHHPNKQLQLSVMPAHSQPPSKQATIALSYASSQSRTTKQATKALRYASAQSSTTQTSNYSSQLCQLIVQHHPNKQPKLSVMPAHSLAPSKQATIALSQASSQSRTTKNMQPQLSVMPAHSPAPPKQATIALSYASSQSSTTQTSNHSSQLCQLIVQHHPKK